MKRFFLLAGEKSGDLLGSHLIQSLKQQFPCELEGVGGVEMRNTPFKTIMRTEDFEIIGFSEVLKSLPKLRRQFYTLRNHILEEQPDGVIFIDYPGLNLRMAKALRKKGFKGKLIQYISPTVWAWGKGRIEKMAESLDLLLTIYPFEKQYFEGSGLPVDYVGNPIKEIVQKYNYHEDWQQLFGIDKERPLVAIFPGSRKSEIDLNLPYLIKAAEELKKHDPSVCFAISCAHEKVVSAIHEILDENTLKLNQDLFLLPKTYSYDLMKAARCAIAKSGTVTLELALHNCPTVVIYKLSLLNRLIAQYVMRLNLPHYCIVNILSGEEVFPELIEKGVSVKSLVEHLRALYDEGEKRDRCLTQCSHLPELLKDYRPSEQVAAAVERLFV